MFRQTLITMTMVSGLAGGVNNARLSGVYAAVPERPTGL